MKVLLLNGSPRPDGNLSVALKEMERVFRAEGVETELIQVGNQASTWQAFREATTSSTTII